LYNKTYIIRIWYYKGESDLVEPRHVTTNVMRLRPAWIQTSLRIRAVWSGSMLFAISFSTCYRVCQRTAWILIRLRGLSWFCRDAAHLLILRLIYRFQGMRSFFLQRRSVYYRKGVTFSIEYWLGSIDSLGHFFFRSNHLAIPLLIQPTSFFFKFKPEPFEHSLTFNRELSSFEGGH
jgi:hypothetical protein